MTEIPTAGEIQAARKAGLVLGGRDPDGKLYWVGSEQAWEIYENKLASYDR